MTTAEQIAEALGGIRSGDGWIARCPAHDDRTPSLSVANGDGKTLVYCHAGCSQTVVIAALRDAGQWPEAARLTDHRLSSCTSYTIRDADGTSVAVHVREDRPGSGKSMWWTRPNGTTGLGRRPATSLPLYGTERLSIGESGTTVVVTEGERAADAVTSLGALAVGTVTGAKTIPDDDVLSVLAGRDVVLWPDHDEPGRRHMTGIAARLLALGCAPRVIAWSGARDEGDDAADYLARGGEADELAKLIADAQPYDAGVHGDGPPNPHAGAFKMIDGRDFLAEPDDPLEPLIGGLIRPGQVTLVSSPCGSGKSVLALFVIAAIALGGRLFGRELKAESVLLIDVDNPRDEVRRRLKRILAREDAPLGAFKFAGSGEEPPTLMEPQRWATMAADRFKLIVLESQNRLIPAKETDTQHFQRAVSTLRDLASRGPAVWLNGNTTKSGQNSRGSGVLRDGVDWSFEVRDATGWAPDGKGTDWWSNLPEANVAAWQAAVSRKRGRSAIRIAIVCNKARSGKTPDPRVVELQMPEDGPWTTVDVTEEIEGAHSGAQRSAKADAEQDYREARDALARLVQERYLAGDPIREAGAVFFLRAEPHKMGRDPATRLVGLGGAVGDGTAQWRRERWDVARSTNRSNPLVLIPCAEPWPKVASPGGPPERLEAAAPLAIGPGDPKVSSIHGSVARERAGDSHTSAPCGSGVGGIAPTEPVAPQGRERDAILPNAAGTNPEALDV